MSDILEKLRRQLVIQEVDGVTVLQHPDGPFDDVMEEAAEEIDRLRALDYQNRVARWMEACFGPKITADKVERNHRFLEEALELVQWGGCTASEAHQLVDYVYGRPVGEGPQEVGGVMVTLAAFCNTHDIKMLDAGEVELTRIWGKLGEIRAKQAAKPKHSPLPE